MGELKELCDALYEARQKVAALGDEAGPDIMPPEPFPTDVLPEPLRSYVEEAAKSKGCDEADIALPLISALDEIIGDKCRIKL